MTASAVLVGSNCITGNAEVIDIISLRNVRMADQPDLSQYRECGLREIMAFMDTVWLLWFEQEREEGEDTGLLIGVYRTEDDANAAKERLKDQPGFSEYPEGFKAYEYVLGRDSWTKDSPESNWSFRIPGYQKQRVGTE